MKLAVLIVWAYLQRNYKITFFLGLVLLVIFIVSFKFNIKIWNSNSVSEGIVGTYQEKDLPDLVTRLISEPLVEMNEEGRPTPKLASSWEVNNDATEFKFKIRARSYWSDGTPVTPEDITFRIPEVEISYPNSETVQFKLKDAFSAFPSLLTEPVFKKDTLIGTGPYQVKAVEKSVIFITKMILYAPDPKLPEVVIRFYPNEKTAITAFQLGEIQSLLGGWVYGKDKAVIKIVGNKTSKEYSCEWHSLSYHYFLFIFLQQSNFLFVQSVPIGPYCYLS